MSELPSGLALAILRQAGHSFEDSPTLGAVVITFWGPVVWTQHVMYGQTVRLLIPAEDDVDTLYLQRDATIWHTDNGPVIAAVFPKVKPGTFIVQVMTQMAGITVRAGEVSATEWIHRW